jgi:GNAT superfamily N-acetyltransferase
MALVISQATAADAVTIAELIGETEAYYGTSAADISPLAERVAGVENALFGGAPVATVLLARDDEEAVGYASYTYLWPAAGTDRSMYLKELYVRETARRSGVGKAIIDRLRDVARAAGASRVEWTADRDNPTAMDFYERLGVPMNEGKIAYRLSL